MRSHCFPFIIFIGVTLASCGSYRQNILFQVNEANLERHTLEAESNYVVQPGDLLTLEVFTNQGERIVDPNRESFRSGNTTLASAPTQYLVDVKGVVHFPLLDPLNLTGLTLKQAEEILAQSYEKFYEGAYVTLQFTNKRVIVLGAPGGQVIPLHNENMKLTEVLALAQGININGRANNIRVIRDDKVMLADFSTFDGYRKGNFVMRPGDIVYVEPVRRPFIEAMRDYAPMVSIVSSLATLIFVISTRN